MTTKRTPMEMTVEQFIEAFRQRFGSQFVGKPAMRLVEAIQTAMDHAENAGYIQITNRNGFLVSDK